MGHRVDHAGAGAALVDAEGRHYWLPVRDALARCIATYDRHLAALDYVPPASAVPLSLHDRKFWLTAIRHAKGLLTAWDRWSNEEPAPQ